VTVIDRRNHHLFQPLLYQVATAALSPGDIAHPIRAILRRQENARVLLAEAKRIDATSRKVILQDGEVSYDYLVLATGSQYSYFGHDEWQEHAPPLKTLEDALEIRRRILLSFEKAEREADATQRRKHLTFVVVGAGPTGVELAGAIAEIARQVMRRDFRAIDPRESRVLLLEAGPRILAAFPEDLAVRAHQDLERLGVEVRVGAPVTALEREGVSLGNQRIEASTILWAAGISGTGLARDLPVSLDQQGRVPVEPDLTVAQHPEIYVIGDLAAFAHQTGKPLPGVAPVAIQEGRHAAENIGRSVRGEPRHPFRYRDKGSLATIGRAAAVADFGRVRLSGFLAWIVWVFVHIAYLIGFENRVLVLVQWAWMYFTHSRSARLITGDIEELLGNPQARNEKKIA
jgi:NADH dehydrogenase